jgi:2-polyprenyl-6-methoxyphenol hydroxylase-like FAD-dependent oxidoreductase
MADASDVTGRAVVVGGSIGGSLAARVLAEYWDDVVVLDADALPRTAVPRSGVPHGPHFHGLLTRGREVFEELLPGFVDELRARDVPVWSTTRASQHYRRYGWAPRFDSYLETFGASRLLIETVLRGMAERDPRITFREGVRVAGVLADGGRVRGVTTRTVAGGEERIEADFVVDASGRRSSAPDWLESLGFGRPRESTIDAHWGYASAFYRVPGGVLGSPGVGGFPLGHAATGPARTRGGYVLLQEDERYLITLVGSARDYPPVDETGFLAFARTLPFPHIADALENGERLTPIRQWRRTANRLRHFEELDALPERFVCLGDAVCSFNPIYGQGMTVAGLGAMDLRDELRVAVATGLPAGLDGLPLRFQRRLAVTIEFPWTVACGADFRVEGVESDVPRRDGGDDAFLQRLEALSSEDTDVFLRLTETNHMIRPPDWIRDPELRARVERDWDRLGALVKATG